MEWRYISGFDIISVICLVDVPVHSIAMKAIGQYCPLLFETNPVYLK